MITNEQLKEVIDEHCFEANWHTHRPDERDREVGDEHWK